MNADIGYQVLIFALCCLCGIVIAMVFDTFRISRRIVRTGILVTCIEDLLFWLAATVILFALSLKFNNGEIRWYMFVGIALGAVVYFKTASGFIIRFFVIAVKFAKVIIFKTLYFVFFPVRLLLRLINKPLFLVINFGKRGVLNLHRKITFKLTILRKFVRFKPKNNK